MTKNGMELDIVVIAAYTINWIIALMDKEKNMVMIPILKVNIEMEKEMEKEKNIKAIN